jgi:carbamoyltransferase
MKGSYLGPAFSDDEIESFLKEIGAVYERLSTDAMIARTAEALAAEKVVGWLQGRMEFGPRSLGCRSILGDPRSRKMQSIMNLKIKFRESFRPFAPSVLREHVADYFDLDCDSPYMLLVAPVSASRRIKMTDEQQGLFGIDKLNVARSDLPSITHVDYSARIRPCTRKPTRVRALTRFRDITGCPVLVNTSFNVRGEPIVCTPKDAYLCFMRTEMDALVLGSFVLDKARQPALKEDVDWRALYQLD